VTKLAKMPFEASLLIDSLTSEALRWSIWKVLMPRWK